MRTCNIFDINIESGELIKQLHGEKWGGSFLRAVTVWRLKRKHGDFGVGTWRQASSRQNISQKTIVLWNKTGFHLFNLDERWNLSFFFKTIVECNYVHLFTAIVIQNTFEVLCDYLQLFWSTLYFYISEVLVSFYSFNDTSWSSLC